MDICLDSNEYLFTFGIERRKECIRLLTFLSRHPQTWRIRLPRLVIDEVTRNLSRPFLKECHRFWKTCGAVVDEEEITSLGTIKSYRERGLKAGDATIAGYCEHVGVGFLISENRDFLSLVSPLPFRVVNAAEFLKIIVRPSRS